MYNFPLQNNLSKNYYFYLRDVILFRFLENVLDKETSLFYKTTIILPWYIIIKTSIY